MQKHGTDTPFGELVLREAGKTAAILGGGPSLPADLEKVPADALLISVNQHGLMLTECDYTVYLDDHVGPVVSEFESIRISMFRDWTDFRLIHFVNPGSSSILAAWVAYMLGCCPIILCGMDCYAGGTYWHNEDAKSQGTTITVQSHVARWRQYQAETLGDAVVRAASGPLIELFGEYEPGKRYEPINPPTKPTPRERVEKLDGTLVRFLRGTCVNGQVFTPGMTERLSLGMAQYIAGMGKCELIDIEV